MFAVRLRSLRSVKISSLARPSFSALSIAQKGMNVKPVINTQKFLYSTSDSQKPVKAENVFEFQAETKKLLQIVAHSLYSQREVFIRELISNASDAMEKLRYLSLTDTTLHSQDSPQIDIFVDKDKKTISIQDNGIGMTEKELIENLGTIARSGSKKYIESLNSGETNSSEAAKNIVGQFGVGFYSGFMVGDSIEVFTRSAIEGSKAYHWKSDGYFYFLFLLLFLCFGLGYYSLSEIDDSPVGTKIVINVKEDAAEYLDLNKIKEIVKKYSNFVGFPINVNSEKVNTVDAMWLKDKNSITEQDHEQFFKFISKDYDSPMFSLVYRTDAPISIKSILYIPKYNPESMGFERLKPSVSLYSRKVLIMPNAEKVLPEWLRFIKEIVKKYSNFVGFPINVNSEKVNTVDAMWLKDKNSITEQDHEQFFKFISKDYDSPMFSLVYRTDAPISIKSILYIPKYNPESMGFERLKPSQDIASLLRFESSSSSQGELTSFDEYVARLGEGEQQKEIFYLCTSSRSIGEESPYYEAFKGMGKEVLFMTQTQDEHVMTSLGTYKGKELVSIDSEKARSIVDAYGATNASSRGDSNGGEEGKGEGDAVSKLTKEEADELSAWTWPFFVPSDCDELRFTGGAQDDVADGREFRDDNAAVAMQFGDQPERSDHCWAVQAEGEQ
ncbi:Heat shock protein 75 kDa, mitochondrial [Smittium culicis]|uniref:Heat shock protein 75 kDa, mitochondrial n=1 Tax=Smittium culicis TaxID=133412 RepID=A0A1R1YBY9_9FUNG|nr:Heat shock protein 75 kDa, mitochondrial [Smittium culicis]